ncbi:hypothetical protein CEXT_429711 [Caerostris extrusa]|uniref:Uncharacterized protein n=1 Tax=Caerostris extrusa TaxID=172846 RepID=A0AAV4PY05_CAEEX|nr:hypothetical protein CEXT_429711 [Caerostris extrusa]
MAYLSNCRLQVFRFSGFSYIRESYYDLDSWIVLWISELLELGSKLAQQDQFHFCLIYVRQKSDKFVGGNVLPLENLPSFHSRESFWRRLCILGEVVVENYGG